MDRSHLTSEYESYWKIDTAKNAGKIVKQVLGCQSGLKAKNRNGKWVVQRSIQPIVFKLNIIANRSRGPSLLHFLFSQNSLNYHVLDSYEHFIDMILNGDIAVFL